MDEGEAEAGREAITDEFRDGVRAFLDGAPRGEAARLAEHLGWTAAQLAKFTSKKPAQAVNRAQHADLLEISRWTKVPLPEHVLTRIYAQLDGTLSQLRPLSKDPHVDRAAVKLEGLRNRINALARRNLEIDEEIRKLVSERSRNNREAAERAHELARAIEESEATATDAMMRLAGATGSAAVLRAAETVKAVKSRGH